MPLYLNGRKTGNYLYLGSRRIAQAYLNGQLVYQMRVPFDDIIYNTAGIHDFIVPAGNKFVDVEVYGARGQSLSSGGGNGGKVTCRLAVTAGQHLYCYVGFIPTGGRVSQYNASDIRTTWDSVTGNSLNDRIVTAGGGGNGGFAQSPAFGRIAGAGGAGGYPNGNNGGNAVFSALTNGNGGSGALQNSAGGGGSAWYGTGGDGGGASYGSVGSFGLGGTGGAVSASYGGAGGAGWYGGGGAGCGIFIDNHSDWRVASGGGGAGSSYANPTYCSNIVYTGGDNSGNGWIKIKQVVD